MLFIVSPSYKVSGGGKSVKDDLVRRKTTVFLVVRNDRVRELCT